MINEEIETKLKEAEEKLLEWAVNNLSIEQVKAFMPIQKEYVKRMVDMSVDAALNKCIKDGLFNHVNKSPHCLK